MNLVYSRGGPVGGEERKKGKQGPHNSLPEGEVDAIRGRERLHCIRNVLTFVNTTAIA